MSADRIVAVGFLTQRDLDLLGPSLARVWPIEEAPHFAELLQAIDEADRELSWERGCANLQISEREGCSGQQLNEPDQSANDQ